jgi:hypothetical protein
MNWLDKTPSKRSYTEFYEPMAAYCGGVLLDPHHCLHVGRITQEQATIVLLRALSSLEHSSPKAPVPYVGGC